jgi:beta-lactamase class D
VLTGLAKIWVRLGCNKNSRGLLEAPKVAIGAVKLQLVTAERWTVTAEVASSSLVVPAITFNHLQALIQTDQGILGDDKR